MKQTAQRPVSLSNRFSRLQPGRISYPVRVGPTPLCLREPEEKFGPEDRQGRIELTPAEWTELLDVAMCLSGVLRLGKGPGRFEESGAKELFELAARRFEKILKSVNTRLEGSEPEEDV